MLGELAEESPLRAHGITTSQGSEREPLHELWITEKVRMSLRSKIASREQDLPVSRSACGHSAVGSVRVVDLIALWPAFCERSKAQAVFDRGTLSGTNQPQHIPRYRSGSADYDSRAEIDARAEAGSTSYPVARGPDQLSPSSNPSCSRPGSHLERHSLRGIATFSNPV